MQVAALEDKPSGFEKNKIQKHTKTHGRININSKDHKTKHELTLFSASVTTTPLFGDAKYLVLCLQGARDPIIGVKFAPFQMRSQ